MHGPSELNRVDVGTETTNPRRHSSASVIVRPITFNCETLDPNWANRTGPTISKTEDPSSDLEKSSYRRPLSFLDEKMKNFPKYSISKRNSLKAEKAPFRWRFLEVTKATAWKWHKGTRSQLGGSLSRLDRSRSVVLNS